MEAISKKHKMPGQYEQLEALTTIVTDTQVRSHGRDDEYPYLVYKAAGAPGYRRLMDDAIDYGKYRQSTCSSSIDCITISVPV